MELRHLRYFVAVAEERHFGRAAERLHIAQPPLSQQIRRFEAELGEPLLYRTTRSVELAPAGEVLLERGREILAAVDSAVEDARRAARGEYGRLAIGFTGSSTYAMLPALAAALRDGAARRRARPPGRAADAGAGRAARSTARSTSGSSGRRSTSATSAPRCSDSEPLARRAAGVASARRRRRGPARAARGRAVRHLSVALPLGRARRRRGRLRGPRLQARRRARGRRDRDARELRRRRPRRLARPGVGAQHDGRRARSTARSPDDATRVELAAAWRRDDDRPVLARALDVIRGDVRT